MNFSPAARFSKTVNILSKYEKRRIFSTSGQEIAYRVAEGAVQTPAVSDAFADWYSLIYLGDVDKSKKLIEAFPNKDVLL